MDLCDLDAASLDLDDLQFAHINENYIKKKPLIAFFLCWPLQFII